MLKKEFLFQEKSALSLAFVRIILAGSILWDGFIYFVYGEALIVDRYYDTELMFKYQFFEWVVPWPQPWMMYATYWIMMLAAFFAVIGFYYYISQFIMITCFTYLFLLNSAYYLNHFYLLILMGYLLMLLPANRAWALDCFRNLPWKPGVVPYWSILSFAIALEIVLIYAGIVKLNADWLSLEPLGMWLRDVSRWHIFGDLAYQNWFVALGAYSSIAIHLIGAPLLWFKKTRLPVFLVYCVFHALNSYTFSIGVFPFYTIGFTTIFFASDWPVHFKQWYLDTFEKFKSFYANKPIQKQSIWHSMGGQKILIAIITVFLIVHALFPLRQFYYPGDASWSEEGHTFSWRMMLRQKTSKHEDVSVRIVDPDTGQEWVLGYFELWGYVGSDFDFRLSFQLPDLIIQFVKFLEKKWKDDYHVRDPEIYVTSWVSLNGRDRALIVDPNVDLTTKEWGLAPSDWVLPNTLPLKAMPKQERTIDLIDAR